MNSHNFIELSGLKFGLLTVINQAERKKKKVPLWNCICECGNTKVVEGKNLRGGLTRSCGCMQTLNASTVNLKHGRTNTPEYGVWCGMKRRCYNSHEKCYQRYGAVGIRLSDEWLNSFETFINDMGERPSEKHSIDRIDSSGNYSKENCRWALPDVQNKNRKSSVTITHEGKTMVLSEWAKATGIKPETISMRIKHLGWDVARALTTQPRKTQLAPS